jgi:dipeptidyl aminopeptidase/acylaminoacyl peptidase
MIGARTFLRWGLWVVAVWVVVCTIVGVVATGWALHPMRRAPTQADVERAKEIAARDHASLTDVQLTAEDGVVLRGWSMRPDLTNGVKGNGDAVIFLHGQSDNWGGMLGYADMLLRHGYAVVLPNARGHGSSGGELTTYGVKEAGDVRLWYDWTRQNDAPRCIDGLGESMGAAVLLESLKTTPGFCAVVAECPFASFREASYDRLAGRLGAGEWLGRTLLRPAVEAGFLYARLRYGVDLDQASPEDAVAGSRVPVLLIHGKKDTNLPPRQSELIVGKSAGRVPAVALWEPVDAGHTGAAGAEPKEFERRVVGWFAGHLAS